MVEKFISYYQSNKLFKEDDKILLTVSGGKDSVLMVHLFIQAKLNFGIAHGNFKLRGEEADKDEEFVKKLANKYHVSFHSTSFNTTEYSQENGISIQMAARELRYNWFEKLRTENNYQYIATAHHKNDVAETMLINLTKGTGLKGLHGIKNKSSNIIRPILCFDSNEIAGFIKQNNIIYREDKSNADTKYVRNKIRHKVISELQKINPSLIETLNTEANQFLEIEQILEEKIQEEKKKCFEYKKERIEISISKILKLKPLNTYLYYFLKDYNFNVADIKDVIASLKGLSGKVFYTNTHQLTKDRDCLIIEEKTNNKNIYYTINSIDEFKTIPIKMSAKKEKVDATFSITTSTKTACLDLSKIKFPITLRHPQKGDAFRPIGMKGNKKLSDFFIDNKLSLVDKKNVWLLESNNKIAWVVAHRIDDKFKVTPQTKQVLTLTVD